MSWSDEQKKQVLAIYWNARTPKCPQCNTPIEVRELSSSAMYSVSLMINCPRCGEGWTEEAYDATEDEAWTEKERKQILEMCWQNVNTLSSKRASKHYAIKCPRDGVSLSVVKLVAHSQSPMFMVSCRKCGRKATVSDE